MRMALIPEYAIGKPPRLKTELVPDPSARPSPRRRCGRGVLTSREASAAFHSWRSDSSRSGRIDRCNTLVHRRFLVAAALLPHSAEIVRDGRLSPFYGRNKPVLASRHVLASIY